MAVWHMTALAFVILEAIRFLVVADRGAVGYDCLDLGIGHGCCGVNTPLSSGVRLRVDHYGYAQFVTEYAFDTAAAYLACQCSAKIDWSSFRPRDCLFPYTVNDGRVHQLSGAEVTSHKSTASDKPSPPQMLVVLFVT